MSRHFVPQWERRSSSYFAHCRLDQSGSGGSRTRGTERLSGESWLRRGDRCRVQACATQRSSPANMCLRHCCRDICMPSIQRAVAATRKVSGLTQFHRPSESETVAWRHRDRSRSRRLCIIFIAQATTPPVMSFVVESLAVEWCGTCTHMTTLTPVQKLFVAQVWLDHLPSHKSCDQQAEIVGCGRDR
jgi:hypothetical protein